MLIDNKSALLILLHRVHDGPDLGFRGFTAHLHEHGSDHLLVNGRIIAELLLEEPTGNEEGDDSSNYKSKNEEENELPDFKIHSLSPLIVFASRGIDKDLFACFDEERNFDGDAGF